MLDSEWDAIRENIDEDLEGYVDDVHQEIARSRFADMLHDTERNKKYELALQVAIEKMHNAGKMANVLDIGTGTGLLSIMAARLGADSIVACEAFYPMAHTCVEILKINGFDHLVTVIPKSSTELTVGDDGDMKQKANILVTEVFDTELIGEAALSTFLHAHEYLLEEDCIVVPDSAVMYAQVVESPTLQKWNKFNDLADDELEVILRVPRKMRDCPGSAAVHDIQLSQLPRHAFKELSERIPVFTYDWSGRTPLENDRTSKHEFVVTNTGKAQVVFMWWELNMDPEGKILLSCAPWWYHPDADVSSERPQDTIPWRDHWMQAVYFLPKELTVRTDSKATLVSCQDEYSLWFYLEDSALTYKEYRRPACECGVHMTFSRTHVSYFNDGRRSKLYLARIREEVGKDDVVLDLMGSSFLGLVAAKMGAKVFIYETAYIVIQILRDYIKENDIENVTIVSDLDDDMLKDVTFVLCEPNSCCAVQPKDYLLAACLLYKYKEKIRIDVKILPERCEFWAMPVEFQNLQKIKAPLGVCEGIDMTDYDNLVEESMLICDDEIELQPLWEYPCWTRGIPRKIFAMDLRNLLGNCVFHDTFEIDDSDEETEVCINGFAVWPVWSIGGRKVSYGATKRPVPGELVSWNEHIKQAVKILDETEVVKNRHKWGYQLVCNLEKYDFDFTLEVLPEAADVAEVADVIEIADVADVEEKLDDIALY